MRFVKFLSALLILLALVACEKVDVPAGTPACHKRKIRSFQGLDDAVHPTAIYTYEVDGETYYGYGYSNLVEAFFELYDEDCNYVCAPSGGLNGQGDGKCPQWVGTPVVTLIWERD